MPWITVLLVLILLALIAPGFVRLIIGLPLVIVGTVLLWTILSVSFWPCWQSWTQSACERVVQEPVVTAPRLEDNPYARPTWVPPHNAKGLIR